MAQAPVIDAHVHLISGTPGNEYLPPRYRWQQCMNWAYASPPPWNRDPLDLWERQEERVADPDGSATVAAMDKAGVSSCVLIHADFGLGHGGLQAKSMEEMHQDYTDIANRYPGRFYPFAGPDPRRPGSLDMVKQGLKDGRFKGQKIFPEMGFFTNDPMVYPFYQANLEAGTPVSICTNFEPAFSRARFNEPIYISDVVADFPDLNVIIFHSGYPFDHWFDVCLAIANGALNTYLTFEPWLWGYRGRAQDHEEDGIRKLARARDQVGAHRIIFGTDGQFSPGNWGQRRTEQYAKQVGIWKNIPETAKKYGISFSQEEVDLMMGLNLARLLRIVDMPEYDKKRKYGWTIQMPRPNPTT